MAQNSLKILVVDDKADNLAVARAVAADAFPGCEVFTAQDGEAGLALARAHVPDVVLLDVRMPGLDGYETCRRLKAEPGLADIPVVFLTAIKINNEARVKASEAGAETFISKPFEEAEFTAQVRLMAKVKEGNLARRRERERLGALVEERTRELIDEADGRQRSEEALKETEGRYSALFERMTEGFALHEIVCDKYGKPEDYRFLEVNPAFEALTGLKRADLIGRTVLQVMPATEKRWIEAYGHVALTRQTLRIEEFSGALGKFYSVIAFSPKQGQFAVIFSDVTARRKADAALRESKALVEAVVENVPLMIFLEEAQDLRFVLFNRAGEELLGYDREALLGKNNLDLFPPEQAAHFMAKDREVLAGGADVLDIPEEPIATAKKGTRLLHTRKVAIHGADGKAKYLLGISEDITERKAAEEKLRGSEEQFRSLAENSTDYIMRYDREGRHTYANPACLKVSGLSAAQFIGKTHHELGFPAELSAEWEKRIRGVFETGKPCGWEFEWESAQGPAFLDWRLMPEFDGRGRVASVLGVSRDITQRRKMESELAAEKRHLDAIVESSPVGLLVLDEDMNIVRVNSAAATIAGAEGKDILPHRCGDALGCVNVGADPRGCGHSSECPLCPLRKGLEALLKDGEPLCAKEMRLLLMRDMAPCEVWLLVGAERVTIDGRLHAVVSIDDITDKKDAEAAEERSRVRYASIFGQSPIAIEYYNADGEMVGANEAAIDMFGVVDISEIAGFSLFDDPNITVEDKARLRAGGTVHAEAVFDFEKVKELKLYRTKRDGSIVIDMRVAPILEGRKVSGYVAQVQDITERKKAEERSRRHGELLAAINASGDLRSLTQSVTGMLARWTGCEAVGIRLKDGVDFPYFETRGFEKDFVLAESRLCARDQAGELIRDGAGNPVLECMCGNVVCGRFDPALPFFTPKGSFWTNSTTELLAGTDEKDRQSRTRNRCNGEGYESVALIPLRSGVEVLGLLQVNSRQKGRLDKGLIDFLEYASDQLAIAVSHLNSQAALKESEFRLKNAQTAARVGNFEINLKKRTVWASEEARRIYGFAQGEKLTLDLVQALALEKYRPGLAAAMARLADGEGCYDEEFEINQQNTGRTLWVHSKAELSLDQHGDPRMTGVLQDITGRKRAEREIVVSAERYEQLAAQSRTGNWETDAAGRYTFVSRVFEEISGYSAAELAGKLHFYDLHPEEGRGAFRAAALEVFARKGEFRDLQNPVRRKDGSVVWVSTSGIPLLSGAGELLGYRGSDTDISDRHRADERIKSNLAEKEVLLKEIHHRVKNNLQVVSSLLNLQAKTIQDEAARAVLKDSRARVRAMALVHEILYRSEDFSRLNMREYASRLIDGLRGAYSGGGSILFEADICDCPLSVDTAVSLGLILSELVSNALKHAFPGGRGGLVKISIAPENGGYLMAVEDDGPGLPADYDLRKAGSLGMQLVTTLAGQISGVAAAGKGKKGARFTVRF